MRFLALFLTLIVILNGLAGGAMADTKLELTADTQTQLKALRAEHKFGPDPGKYYPGANDPRVKQRCSQRVDSLIDRLISGLPSNPTKSFVLREFSAALSGAEIEDSEEQDRTLLYLEQIMDILGIESSDGLLNRWRYGFDPQAP